MNIDSNNFEQQQPAKCKSCKLFFGSQDFKGLCSSCHKKNQKSDQSPAIVQTKNHDIEPIVEKPISQVVKKEQKQQKEESQPKQIDRKKCFECRKKVGIMGNQCKCGFVFCNSHRLPEQHSCSFNFHESGKKTLEKELQKVYNGKITQI